MSFQPAISNAEAERVLSGGYVAPGEPGPSPDLAAFAVAVRAAVPEVPDPGLEASLIPGLPRRRPGPPASASLAQRPDDARRLPRPFPVAGGRG